MKLFIKFLLPSLALTSALALLSGFNASAKVPVALPSLIASISYLPPPPPDRGAPGNRGEGASRGCVAADQPLMALVPQTASAASAPVGSGATTQVWGLTSADHPRFWFSVPYDPAKVSAIEFVLQDSQDQTIYRTPVSVPSTPGIMAVQIPATVGGLAIDQPYHWFLKVRAVCEPNQAPTLEYVEGWVQRTQLAKGLSDRLAQATPQQQAALYAENGIWYDALTTLAELKLAQPNDRAIAQDWTDLLKAVGLEKLATQPLSH